MVIVDDMQIERFMDDLVTMITGDSNWGGTFGTLPRTNKTYDRKVIGLTKRLVEAITIYSDLEQLRPFALGTAYTSKWFHRLSATIVVQTNVSETRFQQILNAVDHILKNNVSFTGYIQILVGDVHDESQQLRESWRGLIDVIAWYNTPQIDATEARITESGETRLIENGEQRNIE